MVITVPFRRCSVHLDVKRGHSKRGGSGAVKALDNEDGNGPAKGCILSVRAQSPGVGRGSFGVENMGR